MLEEAGDWALERHRAHLGSLGSGFWGWYCKVDILLVLEWLLGTLCFYVLCLYYFGAEDSVTTNEFDAAYRL
jgi:hypothetical protein